MYSLIIQADGTTPLGTKCFVSVSNQIELVVGPKVKNTNIFGPKDLSQRHPQVQTPAPNGNPMKTADWARTFIKFLRVSVKQTYRNYNVLYDSKHSIY